MNKDTPPSGADTLVAVCTFIGLCVVVTWAVPIFWMVVVVVGLPVLFGYLIYLAVTGKRIDN